MDAAPHGYNWCDSCGHHLARTAMTRLCPVCDTEGIYATHTAENLVRTNVQVNWQDDWALRNRR